MTDRRGRVLVLIALIALFAFFVGLLWGSAPLSWVAVLKALVAPSDDVTGQIVWQLRAPRVAAAFACGGLLALAGALLQVLLRNPLADPYVLGVSGGAAVGALGAMLLGLAGVAINVAALAGAMAAIGIVFVVSYRAADWNVYRLLLTGVMLSAGFGAVISLLLSLAPSAAVKGMLFWLMGDLSQAEGVLAAWIVLILASFVALALAGALNVLSLGHTKAATLGVAVGPLQLVVYFGASLVTATALMVGGAIGFVGLVIPHGIRLLGITDYRYLVPGAVLAGGGFLVVADTLARVLWAPQQLPVGVLTALLGVPVMLVLLSRRL
ncbi:MAG: iron ABC transporter permease [Betaproteobacteria bacterium]|nr:iron ABC transporter permease [Betaproteobacteria bacterium]